MILKKYIPFHMCIMLILGILTGFFFDISLRLVFSVLAITVCILCYMYSLSKNRIKPSNLFAFSSFLTFYIIGILSITIQNGRYQKNHYVKFSNLENVNTTLKIREILKSSHYYDKYLAEVITIENSNTNGSVLLSIRKDSLLNKLTIDTQFLVKTSFKNIEEPKNPHQFNYKKYLERKRVYKQITSTSSELYLMNSRITTFKGIAEFVRKKIIDSLEKNGFKGDDLSIIKSLLLGQRQDVSKELLENYSKAGAIHILAISGLHIGILLFFLNFLLKPLLLFKNGKHLKLVLVLILLWSFAFIAGLSPSIVRAVTMFSAIALSLLGNRQFNIYYALVFSMFLLLLINPYYLFDVGFQMSYLAVSFIVWLQPVFQSIWSPKIKIISYLWKIFTVSLAAQIGVLPLSLFYFHQFPGLFFITNIVIIPFLGIILGLGIITIILSLLGVLPSLIAKTYGYIISLMNQFISWVAKHESFLFENIYYSFQLIVLTYLLIVSLSLLLGYKKRKFIYPFLIITIVFQAYFIYDKRKSTLLNETIIFNQNRATLIGKRKGEKLIFYNSMPNSQSNELINNYIRNNNLNRMEIVDSINSTFLMDNNMLIIDSLGIYNIPNIAPKRILLTQSPKINLNRLLEKMTPEIIIADNSNYRSYINLWRRTCKNKNILFYDTNKEGAFTLDNEKKQ